MAIGNASFPYHEPSIETILIWTTFLLLLNSINFALDGLVYCGLLGQILVGVWFGTPGAQWLSQDLELAVQQLGYLGLIMLVYEGGLSTDIKTLKQNLLLSSCVAVTGISAPIGFSFALQSLVRVDALESFAAGAALCSTSLGTTFTILTTSGLVESRLGVVLTSAAMMDDVVGLVMVQIISSLGKSSGSFSTIIVVRPVFVSIAYAVATPLVCAYIVTPLAEWCLRKGVLEKSTSMGSYITSKPACFVWQSLFLIAMVASATYAGTSGLFAAYLAGVVASWYATMLETKRPASGESTGEAVEIPLPNTHDGSSDRNSDVPSGSVAIVRRDEASTQSSPKGAAIFIYQDYYQKPVGAILKPCFFASIGFSIPVTRMFEGDIVWRGIVYTILMIFGKLLCGLWLVRLSNLVPPFTAVLKGANPGRFVSYCVRESKSTRNKKNATTSTGLSSIPSTSTDAAVSSSSTPERCLPVQNGEATTDDRNTATLKSSLSQRPLSLYPCFILGSAMVARGEIGFLISAVAQSSGVISSDLFLVVTWAIFLCTFVGPIAVGLLVRRVKKLQGEQRTSSGKSDPLGVWGISSHAH